MNIIEALRVWRNDLPYGTGGQPEYIEAAKEIDSLVAAYDALAPKPEDWAAFPWAKWCTIDYQGRFFWECEPEVDGYRYWNRLAPKDGADYGLWNCDYLAPKPDVRVGLDWRDCKWMRPEEDKEVPVNEIASIIAMTDSAAKRLSDYGISTREALRNNIEREPGVVALVANVSLERVWAWMGELDPSILAEKSEGVQP